MKCIIFDWDGTIVNSLALWSEAYQTALIEQNIDISEDDFSRRFFHNHYELFRCFPSIDKDLFLRDARDTIYASAKKISLNYDVQEVLRGCRCQGNRLAIVSSCERRTIELVLGSSPLNLQFDTVIPSSTVRRVSD